MMSETKTNKSTVAKICELLKQGCSKPAAATGAGLTEDELSNLLDVDEGFAKEVAFAANDYRIRVEAAIANQALDGDKTLLMFIAQNLYQDPWKNAKQAFNKNDSSAEDERMSGLSEDELIKILEESGCDLSGFKNPKTDK